MMQQPSINVKFILDDGKPVVIHSGNLKHYKIEISIGNIPDDVYGVNYQLDQSYINPYREETDKSQAFRFTTTTYGDFSLSASLQGRKQNYLTSNTISRALREAHRENSTPEIEAAINDIKEY